jgi:hypothetical protein
MQSHKYAVFLFGEWRSLRNLHKYVVKKYYISLFFIAFATASDWEWT